MLKYLCKYITIIYKCIIYYSWYEDFSLFLCTKRYLNLKTAPKNIFLLFLKQVRKQYCIFLSLIFTNAIYFLSLYLCFTFENAYSISFSKHNLLKESLMSTLMLHMPVFISCKNRVNIKEMTTFFSQEGFKM